jgi:hypothetical protein
VFLLGNHPFCFLNSRLPPSLQDDSNHKPGQVTDQQQDLAVSSTTTDHKPTFIKKTTRTKMDRLSSIVLLSALSTLSVTAFTVMPLSNDISSLRLANPLKMATTASTPDFDFNNNDEQPDRLPRQSSSASSSSASEDGRRRRERVQEQTFVTGDELHRLRHEVLAMRLELQEARLSSSMERKVNELERSILKAQQLDAEFVYMVSLERVEAAEQEGLLQEVEQLQLLKGQAMEARSALPQFNLEGLWVGKYGDHGYEMINVTYVGDTLVASKVTGTKNVPKGEATFEVDLSPQTIATQDDVLEPIELEDSAANQWGSKYLQRFLGRGQVAAEGYLDSQWVEGQLIMVNDYFSFAWLPIGHQVFFGRPTAELILKLLKDEDETKKETGEITARAILERCWEETEDLQDEIEVTEGPFNSMEQQDYYHQEGCFE